MREGGGNCLKYLKRRWNRKEGRGHKDFKRGGKLGQGVGALKAGGWNPLTNCVYTVLNQKRRDILSSKYKVELYILEV